MTSARALLRGSATLLAGRAAQAVLGIAILALTTRALDVRGFGDFAAGLAVASLLGGVLNAALSDSYVVSDDVTPSGTVHRAAVVLTLVGAAGAGLATGRMDAAVAALAVGTFTTASVGTAARLAAARAASRSLAIAVTQLAGSAGTLALVAALSGSGSTRWQLYLLAYSAQPAAVLLLPRAPGGQGGRRDWRAAWQASRPFLAAQVGWTVLSQANVLLLRVIVGAEAAGRYAALVRLLDFLAIVGPLMAVLALPALVRAQQSPGHAARLNAVVAAAGTVALVGGMQLGWLGWRLLYGNRAFPGTVFALVALGYGISAACGLPDRVLQARGRAGTAAGFATLAAIACLLLGGLLIPLAGTTGAAAGLAVVVVTVNVGMLQAGRPPGIVVAVHAGLGAVVLLAVAGVLAGVHSIVASLALALALSLVAVVPLYLLRRSSGTTLLTAA
jgi:O-antigen/teichoic acid export membrane protein